VNKKARAECAMKQPAPTYYRGKRHICSKLSIAARLHTLLSIGALVVCDPKTLTSVLRYHTNIANERLRVSQ